MPVHFLPENEVQMSQAAQTSEEAAVPERKLAVAPDSQSKSSSGMPYPNWSRFMKKLSKKTGKSGTQIAEAINVSQTQVSRWNRGLARPATMEGALEMVASIGGDVQAAQAAWNADVPRPRGRAARKAAVKAVKTTPAPTARKKPGPKPGTTRAAKKATSVEKPATRSTTPPLADGGSTNGVLEGISFAQRALVEAERGIDEAVAAARAAGISWPEIGKALSER